jgi:hypothetical protein
MGLGEAALRSGSEKAMGEKVLWLCRCLALEQAAQQHSPRQLRQIHLNIITWEDVSYKEKLG